jgi:superfamily II DNA helicase RecQ
MELSLDSLSTYGLLKEKSRSEIHAMTDHLEAEGYLLTDTEFQTVGLTPSAGMVLYRGKTVQMKVEVEPEISAAVPVDSRP